MSIAQDAKSALQAVQTQIRWKSGALERHLHSRKLRGHLPPDATVTEYENRIHQVVSNPANWVYIYQVNNVPYVTIVDHGAIAERPWLVIFDMNGIMETAFIVENPSRYLNKPEFSRIGSVQELLS